MTSSAFKESLKLSSSQSSRSSSAKSQKNSKSGSKASESGQRDSTLFLFHALGKILHCKREAPTTTTASAKPLTTASWEDSGIRTSTSLNANDFVEKPLPKHLAQHYRDPLQCIPEDVVAKTSVSGDMFNLYLHQNYPDYYVGGVGDVAAAAEYLSLADTLTAAWTTKEAMIG